MPLDNRSAPLDVIWMAKYSSRPFLPFLDMMCFYGVQEALAGMNSRGAPQQSVVLTTFGRSAQAYVLHSSTLLLGYYPCWMHIHIHHTYKCICTRQYNQPQYSLETKTHNDDYDVCACNIYLSVALSVMRVRRLRPSPSAPGISTEARDDHGTSNEGKERYVMCVGHCVMYLNSQA